MPIFASIHIGKTAGTSFAYVLRDSLSHRLPVFFYYGTGHRLTGVWIAGARLDMGDAVSKEQLAERFMRHAEEYGAGIIQAHWTVCEFLEALHNPLEFITWLRDPVQRICSLYFFWKNSSKCAPVRRDVRELFWAVKSGRCSLLEFGTHPEICNPYQNFFAPLGLKGITFAGIVERQTVSLQHLSRLLGTALPDQLPRENVAKQKQGPIYSIPKDVEEAILAYNASDVTMYAEALARLDPGDS
jgi:hypothetical protein